MTKKVLYRIATLLGLIAILFVSTASTWYIYQGDTPEELL
ncbi:cyclic lactone autoinducer peptide [Paenibacillus phyllosphaerae]|uniref:Cyclic lactone autoinducer peptide n=1 Tax=Paenibacillus phyllosphaerae TaxID=274593 RepID=A0A7W5B453_9BACL|nr:cyclic lactone autoinducer peptide [Paenibacillus phyllosphaerae]MBB3113611.1 cyclic lactone autoinducer peptide [Paenibacillus phyllosphaerae]